MNLRKVILRYLGWCKGIGSASHFSDHQRLTLPTISLNARLIILIILATFGFKSIYSTYNWWFNTVPTHEISPIVASSWRALSDLLYCLGALGLTGLAAVVFRTGTISRSHSKMLAAIFLSFGLSKLVSSPYLDIRGISSMGLRYLRYVDFRTFAKYFSVVVYSFIAFRILTNKPIISKSTLGPSSLLCVSLIIREATDLIGFPYTERLLSFIVLAAYKGLYSLFLVLTLWFLVNGYQGKWSSQTLLTDGFPEYFRVGLLGYSFRIILPIPIGLVLHTEKYIEEISRNSWLITSFIFQIIFGLSIILAALSPLKLNLIEANT